MNRIEEKDAFGRVLPKWPQMLVTGDRITVEQAKEIIFATDYTLTAVHPYAGGNDRAWNESFYERTGYALLFPIDDGAVIKHSEKQKRKLWALIPEFEKRAGFLQTEYVRNNWASSAYAFGPYGWCHPNGEIRYVDNVGKWPNVEDIANEWKTITARWPFLNVWITLMSGEQCEEDTQPVVTFHVVEGGLQYFEGTLTPHRGRAARDFEHVPDLSLHARFREHGLPEQWIKEFIARVRPIVDELLKESID